MTNPSKPRRQPPLLFVDTNIWLDFYRARSELAKQMLGRLEAVFEHMIVTGQLEMEFKKNRHQALLEGHAELKKSIALPSIPGLFVDDKSSDLIKKGVKDVNARLSAMSTKMKQLLANPARHDPVFQTFQRLLKTNSELNLRVGHDMESTIYRRALRRFLSGKPPRKKSDTSCGDAMNWEWIVECARRTNRDVVIVSRDGDFGSNLDSDYYANDYLNAELSARAGRRRKLHLHQKTTQALKLYQIQATKKEREEELRLVKSHVRDDIPLVPSFMRLDHDESWKTAATAMRELAEGLSRLKGSIKRAAEAGSGEAQAHDDSQRE